MFKTERLKQEIEDKNLTYAELDRRMGTNNQAGKYANGNRQPTPPTLAKFLRVIGWTEEEIADIRLSDWYEIF